MYCASCGKSINHQRARFCAFCGSPLHLAEAPQPSPTPSRVADDLTSAGVEMLLVPARCAQSRRPFLIRMKRAGAEEWRAVAAFALNEERLRNPEFGNARISGRLKIDGDYPGCPHCRWNSLFVDGHCGSRISCIDPGADSTECPWCGNSAQVKALTNATIKGLGDR